MLTSLVFYIFAFGIVLYLVHYGENRKSEGYILFGYVLFFCLSAFRFDIGNDYSNYYRNALIIGDRFQKGWGLLATYDFLEGQSELGYLALVQLFSLSGRPFVWITILFAMISTCIFYHLFKKYRCHFWGLFFVFCSEFLFFSWDCVRQGTAIVIVLLAIDFLQQGKYFKFGAFVVGASLLHSSAIYMLAVLPLKFISLKSQINEIIVAGALALYWVGIFDGIVENLAINFMYTEGYENYVDAKATLSLFTSVAYKFRVTLYSLIWIAIAYAIPEKERLFKNMITLGAVIFIIGGGSMIFTRISWYFVIVAAISVSMALNTANKLYRKVIIGGLVFMSLLFMRDIYTNTNAHGCVPYETIFSDEFENEQFRIRDYK